MTLPIVANMHNMGNVFIELIAYIHCFTTLRFYESNIQCILFVFLVLHFNNLFCVVFNFLNVNSDESNDGRDIVPDPECDINIIVPVVEAKGFRGFFIMPNGSVVPDYEFAVDAFDDSDDDDIDQFLSGFTSSNPKLN